VSDVSALAGLTNLSSLDLVDTQVSDVSVLAGLTNLSSLDLQGTLASGIEEFKAAVPGCFVFGA